MTDIKNSSTDHSAASPTSSSKLASLPVAGSTSSSEAALATRMQAIESSLVELKGEVAALHRQLTNFMSDLLVIVSPAAPNNDTQPAVAPTHPQRACVEHSVLFPPIKNSSTDHSAARPTSSSKLATARNDVVVGFEDDLLAIQEQLCGESSSLQVIPIVGMGGIGKTTLARNAYHDPLIRESFYIGGWVTVSQSYSVEEIISCLKQSLKPLDTKMLEESHESAPTKKLEESQESAADAYEQKSAGSIYEIEEYAKKMTEEAFKPSPKESPAVQVYQTLKGRKYLIVLDDIWHTHVWDQLKMLFPNDKNGSRIMLTTRIRDVATYADDCRPHEMRLMHEDQSWDMLQQKLAMEGVCDPELEDIGKEIARNCGGLPLAIVVIAGLLSTVDRTRASWEKIKERVNSTVAAKDGQLERILSLSYTDLPRYLRQCFVYMGGFPEDCEIHAAELIKLWEAEGFVGAITAAKSVEEEAEECLQALVKRSLVFVGKRKHGGEIKSCSLHDLMRDLCKRKADEDGFLLYETNVNKALIESFRVGSFEDIKVLRAEGWDTIGKGLYDWTPDQIFQLSGLRYLVLHSSLELPSGISNLENLQTLIIHANRNLVRLPREIWRMQQLKHLVSIFDQLPCPWGAFVTCFPLENLQTLSKVSNLECSHGFVKMIPNIKKLGLVYSAYSPSLNFEQDYHLINLKNLYDHDHAPDHIYSLNYRFENLKWLQQLEKLKVQVYAGFQGRLNPVFPPSLKRLTLSGWKLTSWSDMTIFGSLPNLQVLKLIDFGGQYEKWETAEGEFPRLSVLRISSCDLRDWITEREHFPRLKWLMFCQCPYLHEIPTDIGEIPTLELIEVERCNKSLRESAKRIEEEQEEMGNDSLQVRCI